jgi:hypothetical protein
MNPTRTSAPPCPSISARHAALALGLCLVFVVATRLPVSRTSAFDFDEVGYLEMIREADFPMHHTLFLASAKVLGEALGDPYRGFVALDMIVSALALWATWWFLRAVVSPRTAAASTLVLGVGPVFWSYGAMAANYTAIVLVGSTLLGIAARGRADPRPWHPMASAVVLALGTGYRQDIGLFWTPVFLAILWRYRWVEAVQAILLFGILNFAWLIPMLRDAGGWASYRAQTAEFAEKAGRRNSLWNLGAVDATLRYGVKAAMALTWTLGIGLLFVPRGLVRLWSREEGRPLLGLMVLAAIPALAMHLLVHFGVAGYAFHYVPALVALMALGLSRMEGDDRSGTRRALAVSAVLASLFLFYPTDLNRTDLRGDFDLAFARHTRVGLATKPPLRDPDRWRTINSQQLPGNALSVRPDRPRTLFRTRQRGR